MVKYNIISQIQGDAPKQKNICCFAHYDKDGIIDTYVINYLQQIKEQLKCEIIFTSTAPSLRNPEDIKHLCSQIIHRQNEYYDFGSYLCGLSMINPHDYDAVLFANDSIYGGFADISYMPKKMEAFDIWGLTDTPIHAYHIHSYFIWFNKSSFAFLDKFASNYTHPTDTSDVIKEGEVGLSQQAVTDNLSLSAVWNYEEISYELLDDDELKRKLPSHQSLMDKAFFRGWTRHRFKRIYNRPVRDFFRHSTMLHWRELIEQYDFPFIKIRMLRENRYAPFHHFKYDKVIRTKFPDYDINLIRKHLHRVR